MLCSLHLPGEGLDAEGGAASAAVEGGGPPLSPEAEAAAEAAAPAEVAPPAEVAAAEAAEVAPPAEVAAAEAAEAAAPVVGGCNKCRYALMGCKRCKTFAENLANGFYFGPNMEVFRNDS